VEAIVADAAGARAVAFDPSSGRRAGRDYLTVATGRDYTDVTPTSGTYLGTARGTLTATKRVAVALA
jgi:transglutaminase-like putative cysteine protease